MINSGKNVQTCEWRLKGNPPKTFDLIISEIKKKELVINVLKNKNSCFIELFTNLEAKVGNAKKTPKDEGNTSITNGAKM